MKTKPLSAEGSKPAEEGSCSPMLVRITCSSVFIIKFGGTREPTVLAPPVVMCCGVVKLRVCGTLHLLLPFNVRGRFDVVSTRGGGFGDRPPATAVGLDWVWTEEGIGTGNTPGPDGVGCFRFPELPPDPELNPDASELVAITLPRSDKEDSSKMKGNIMK